MIGWEEDDVSGVCACALLLLPGTVAAVPVVSG